MPKEDIFSKINLKDYNNILENVLEQKAFSKDVKNLLLSMLYKIENGYQDYKKVKVNASSKNYFLEKLIKTIKEDCKEIKLIKPLSDESKILEEKNVNFIVNREEGKILTYPNERIILEALGTMNEKTIKLQENYEICRQAIEEVLYKGYQMNISEVIRDFNGWSWDITSSQMESKNINLVYQNLNILLGSKFLNKWITQEEVEIEEVQIPNNEILRSKYNNTFGITKEEVQEKEEIDYIELLKQDLESKYGIENSEKFINQLKKVIIAIGCNSNEEQKQLILNKKQKIEKELEKMQDNKKYLEELVEKKKIITQKIKDIDKMLSDEELLKEEYEKRNSKLPNKQKIFSVSHLRIMLEKERINELEKIKQYNKQMEPNEFVKIKNELQEKNEFFQDINIKETERVNEEKQINRLQIYFLDCFIKKIQNVENKQEKEIKDLIYELRYYEQMPYQGTIISKLEIMQLKEKIDQTEEELIKKACKQNVLVTFTKQEKLNKRILENQFKSKIINLENTSYLLKYHKGILKIEIYDTNIEEEIKEISITEKVELQVKLNKKIKISSH